MHPLVPYRNWFALALLLLLATALPAAGQMPDNIGEQLSPKVQRLLGDDLLSDDQRRELLIFHGQWDQLEDRDDLNARDLFALLAAKQDISWLKGHEDDFSEVLFDLQKAGHDVDLSRDDFDDLLFSMAALYHNDGQPQHVIAVPNDFDHLASHNPRWRLLIARSYEDMGQYPDAVRLLTPLRERAQTDLASFATAEDLTAGAQAILMLARLEGRPSADFHLANQMLSKAHQEVDPLYWPAYVVEAELLMGKGNPQQAIEACAQALSLNPKSSEAWYQMGSMMTRFFNFDAANNAVEKLRGINPEHPLADALAVQIALRQKDVETAREVIEPALERYPAHRKLRALLAAVEALAYNEPAVADELTRWEELAPGNPLASHTIGQTLASARQYALAEPYLKQAIVMMPGWSEPQLELGELYMQWGKLEDAARQLQIASSLDPFHKQITNQLTLSQEMLGYATIETENFIIRYLPGQDEVLARDMARLIQPMADVFIERFQHDPPEKCQIDLMPDDEHFAVRVTGMPSIWTIAACTGNVIAMTPPRPGPKRAYGTYNWLNVMGHEYAHVVNLSQTHNRVPHWFTEGCAVNMETTGRLWRQYELLAQCYNTNKLFKFDEINWGFIRPTEDYHRSLAYAQSAWIMEYIELEYGWDKAVGLLDAFSRGVGERRAVEEVFGVEPEVFMTGFLEWAGERVAEWGMADYGVPPEDEELALILSSGDEATGIEAFLPMLEKYPDHPGLLQRIAEIRIAEGDVAASRAAIKAYQAARPVDPWSARELTRIALAQGDAASAIESMTLLDKIEGDAPEYASELARVYRTNQDYERALHFAERALLREPYNPTLRELAATVAVQAGNLELAAAHIEALAIIEPDRSIHQKRLAAVYDRLGQPERAVAARERAAALDAR